MCHAQGWQLLSPSETSFFAAVNLPMLDFYSSTGPEADFDSGMRLLPCSDCQNAPSDTSQHTEKCWLPH